MATALLFALSPLIAPEGLGTAPLPSMLPFAAVLGDGRGRTDAGRLAAQAVPLRAGTIARAAVLHRAPSELRLAVAPSVIASVVGPGLVGPLHGLLATEWRVIIPLAATLGMTVVLLLGTVVVIGLAELVTQRTAIGHVSEAAYGTARIPFSHKRSRWPCS